MSIVSNILKRDIATCMHALSDQQIASLLDMLTSEVTLAWRTAGEVTQERKDAGVRLQSAINKRVSDACSTPEAVELCAELGKSKGTLTVTSLSAKGEREQTKVDGKKYVSPAWSWAIKVNKLAAALRRGLDVE